MNNLQPYRGTMLTTENWLVNKHRVVEIKLASLTTGDCLLLVRLWLSPALLVVVETGASLAFRLLQQWKLGQLLRASLPLGY